MFFEKGWTVLSRLTHEAKDKLVDTFPSQEFDEAKTDEERDEAFFRILDSIEPEFHAAVWDMLQLAAEKQALGCTTLSGRTLLVDPWVVMPFSSTSSSGVHIDLYEGTIRPPSADYEVSFPSVEEFSNLPLVVRDAHARAFISGMTWPTLLSPKKKPDEVYVQLILEALDNGEPVTRAWTKENITGRIKSAEFEAIWKAASSVRPMLSRSGPRGPRKTF